MRNLIYLILIAFMFSCSSSKQVVRYTVASQTANCTGVAPQQCLLVKKSGTNNWEYFYNNIEGFNYQGGYEYVIDVREERRADVPADASTLRYILVRQISKKEKTSENMPVNTIQNEIQWVGRVLEIEKVDVGRGAAQGRFTANMVKVQVTSTTSNRFRAGDIIYCELISNPTVNPVIGREYVFKAKNIHPAHVKGIYLLETNVQDLV